MDIKYLRHHRFLFILRLFWVLSPARVGASSLAKPAFVRALDDGHIRHDDSQISENCFYIFLLFWCCWWLGASSVCLPSTSRIALWRKVSHRGLTWSCGDPTHGSIAMSVPRNLNMRISKGDPITMATWWNLWTQWFLQGRHWCQVGFGLGLSAKAIDRQSGVTEHVIIEANEMVMAKAVGGFSACRPK